MKNFTLRFLLALFAFAAHAGGNEGNSGGGGMGGKGHIEGGDPVVGQAGGPERMQNFMGRFEKAPQSAPALPAVVSQLLTSEYLGEYKNFNCEFMQGLLSYGSRVLSYFERTGFRVRNGADLVPFPNYNEEEYFKTYLDGNNCIDLRNVRGADPRHYKQQVILMDDNTLDSRVDLMAANFPIGQFPKEPALTGKIIFFLNNWRKEKLLANDLCRIDVKDDYHASDKTGKVDAPSVPAKDSDFARSCLFLTHLTAAAHEGASINGVKEEQNDNYLFSSAILELMSLNLKKPRARSLELTEYVRKYHWYWYKQSEKLELAATDLGTTAAKLNPGPAWKGSPETLAYIRAYAIARRSAHKLQTEYQKLLEFLDLVVPQSLLIHDTFYEAVLIPELKKHKTMKEFTHLGNAYFEGFAFPDFFSEAGQKPYNDLLRDLFRVRINSELAQERLMEQSDNIVVRFGNPFVDPKIVFAPIKDWNFKEFPGLTDNPREPTP